MRRPQIGDVGPDLEREAPWRSRRRGPRPRRAAYPSPDRVTDNVFFEGEPQQVGGQWPRLRVAGRPTSRKPDGQRINMVTAIRRVLDQELGANPRVLVFGEDVGPKGGVHAVTLGLQDKFGGDRVFDTSSTRKASSAARWGWRWPG